MKKLLSLVFCGLLLFGCSDKYDDSALRNDLNDLENRVTKLEELCTQMNTNISSLQKIVDALQDNLSISKVEQISDGYIIHFSDGSTATIKNGKNSGLRAEGPRNGDGKAAGNAVDKAQHQIVQAAHAAHGRQRFHAHKAAHDDGIGQIVELLEQAAQHQRHREGKDQLERAALGHILCHSVKSSYPPGNGDSIRIQKAYLRDFDREKRPAGRGRTLRTFMNDIIADRRRIYKICIASTFLNFCRKNW